MAARRPRPNIRHRHHVHLGDHDEWIDAVMAARRLGVDLAALRGLIGGFLTAYRIHGEVRIRRSTSTGTPSHQEDGQPQEHSPDRTGTLLDADAVGL
jgi:hypothetical protein